MSTRRPGTCAEPGPRDLHCTEHRMHDYSHCDAGEDESWNDRFPEGWQTETPHDCGDPECPDNPKPEPEPISDRAVDAIVGPVDTDRELRDGPPVVSHLAGPVVEYKAELGTVVRQRCQWCGATLVDECTWLVRVPVGQDPRVVPGWEVGRFVDVVSPDGRGGMWSLNDWTEGKVPETACMRMPLEVTS